MEWIANFVYKNAMNVRPPDRQEFNTLLAGAGAQMILCSYHLLHEWKYGDLSAPFWRWYWNDTAGASIYAGGKRLALGPERVVLIPPNTRFATETRATVGHLYCHFVTGSRIATRFQRPIMRIPTGEEVRSIRRVANLMREERNANDWPAIFGMYALIAAALAEIPTEHWQTSAADANIGRVLAAMHERPSASLDNRALCRIASLSPNSLLRRFKTATGTTPHRYLTRLKVENAGADLMITEDSIEDIAERHGFCDRFHFSRAFKQVKGSGPAAYRAANRKQ